MFPYSLFKLKADSTHLLSFSVHAQLHDYVGYVLPHNRCLFLTENARHRLNARRTTPEKNTSFNVTRALNHLQLEGHSSWTEQVERKSTTMETEINTQVSDGDKCYGNYISMPLILNYF